MESFRPRAPLWLDGSNFEAEWASFQRNLIGILLAIGADKIPDAPSW